MQLTGAEVMVKCLEEEGVSTIFGYPGGAILPFYNALRDVKNIKHVLTAHEQGAAHAADGYARASGKVGVCCATSGPGATNLVTGLANAFLDSIPVVAITGQVKSSMIGHDAFQEVDITGITMPITKQNFLVNKPEELAQTMRLAFQMAKSGRPGPVLVDVAHDVQTSMMEYHASKLRELPVTMPQKELVAAAVAALNKAERPVMLVGGGVAISGAEYEAVHLCEKMHLPVASTLMGLGCISSYREQFLGMSGLHGHERANRAIANADVVLAVGTRFNDRVTGDRDKYSAHKTIIHIDIDTAAISKNVQVDIPIVADAKAAILKILEHTEPMKHEEWIAEVKGWDKEYPLHMEVEEGVNPQRIIETLNEVYADRDTVFTSDVGQHQMWASQYLKLDATHRLVQSGGLGTMGFGLPSAVGAQIGCPEKSVVSISGDGGFQMNMQELATAVCQELPLVNIVFNNNRLGMVRQMQELFFKKRYTITCLRYHKSCKGKCGTPGWVCPEYVPDFVKMAEAYGSKGYFVTSNDQLKDTILEAREYAEKNKKPVIVECMVAPDELVMPMIKGGASFEDIML